MGRFMTYTFVLAPLFGYLVGGLGRRWRCQRSVGKKDRTGNENSDPAIGSGHDEVIKESICVLMAIYS